jgi:hypothetical protein
MARWRFDDALAGLPEPFDEPVEDPGQVGAREREDEGEAVASCSEVVPLAVELRRRSDV